jgi:transglutaminase-like putative cysteine protease
MRRLRIRHATEYRFPSAVQLLPQRLLLRPREHHGLRIASSVLDIEPAATVHWQRDVLDNSIAIASFSGFTTRLHIRSEVLVEHYDEKPLDFVVADYAVSHPFSYQPGEWHALTPAVQLTWPADGVRVRSWLDLKGFTRPGETFALLDSLNRTISREFGYQAREEAGVQSPADTLSRRSGSCRDLAALFLEACRVLGLAARFVSGYHTTFEQDSGDGSTHAWAEVYLPGAGWKGFDPTAGTVIGSEHIAVSVAHHPESVPPVAGSFLGPGTPTMHVSVRVTPA